MSLLLSFRSFVHMHVNALLPSNTSRQYRTTALLFKEVSRFHQLSNYDWESFLDCFSPYTLLTHCTFAPYTSSTPYPFFRLFQCEASREEAMFGTRIVVDIIECLSHKNMHIKRAADRATELGMFVIY